MDTQKGGVPDEEQGPKAETEDSISVAAKCGYGAWGFIFGLIFGLVFGAIPLCFLKNHQRKKFYMFGWGIGAIISLIIVIVIRVKVH